MRDDLIHDWNVDGRLMPPAHPFMLDDETLRDGLQSPSVVDPPIAKKRELLHLMSELGVDTADVGLPGAGPRAEAANTRKGGTRNSSSASRSTQSGSP